MKKIQLVKDKVLNLFSCPVSHPSQDECEKQMKALKQDNERLIERSNQSYTENLEQDAKIYRLKKQLDEERRRLLKAQQKLEEEKMITHAMQKKLEEERKKTCKLQQQLDEKISLPKEASDVKQEECVICMENRNDYAYVKCGHKCVCHDCGSQCNICPICRKESSIIKIY